MDASKPGQTGVLAWCNSIRLSIAQDPGREFLDAQIQKQGFDFLESYREGVFSRQHEAPVLELLKTPSRKKDISKKTRSAAAIAAKLKAANAALKEDDAVFTEKSLPTNDFHKALLHARSNDSKSSFGSEHNQSSHANMLVDDPKLPKPMASVEFQHTELMDVDETEPSPILPEPIPLTSMPSTAAIPTDGKASALQTEPSDHSLNSIPTNVPSEATIVSPMTEFSPKTPVADISERPISPELQPHLDVDTAQDLVAEPVPVHNVGVKELSMIAEGDELEDIVESGLSDVEEGEPGEELTVPIRDEPSSNSLKRKGSMSQFSGLPAPSPLRKSMRMSREPSIGTALSTGPPPAHTPGADIGGKRTSWLTKAQQAKASEGGPGRRHPSVNEGIFSNLTSGTINKDQREPKKVKVGEPLGLGFVFPPPHAPLDAGNEAKTAASKPVADSEPFTFKGKQKATSLDGDQAKIPSQRAEHQTSLPFALPTHTPTLPPVPFHSENDLTVHITDADQEGDVLDRLKKTVEDMGARTGKAMGKSLGGNAAAAALAEMAEARAAAAARVAKRNQPEGPVEGADERESATASTEVAPEGPSQEGHPRLSLSELTTSIPLPIQKPTDAEPLVVQAPGSSQNADIGDSSTSTTPPNSPPVQVSLPPLPVFTKPSAVFTAPKDRAQAAPKDTSHKLPTTNPFSLPPKTLPSATPFSFGPSALSAQSSKATVFSDTLFEQEGSAPAWIKGPQDTEFTIPTSLGDHTADMVEDDSWHVDEKFQSNHTWTPFGFTSSDKDDGSTWSSFPAASTSQRAEDTAFAFPTESLPVPVRNPDGGAPLTHKADDPVSENIVDLNPEHDEPQPQDDVEMEMEIDDMGESPDLEDLVMAGNPTITLVKSKPDPARSNSQQSMASSSSTSSQQHMGLFGQASKFVSSMLGNGKKPKTEPVKSIALAAAAAKKQQEEADKKATRLREMENRRQLALQRKADEEKTRAAEQERKQKEDADRRKREREEHTDKRPIKGLKKPEDDTTKKRKLTVETEKKPEIKKPPSKDGQSSRNIKAGTSSIPSSTTKSGGTYKHVVKQPSVTSLASSIQKPTPKPTASSSNLKSTATKGKSKATDLDDIQPTQLLQSQMAHRANAQIHAATPRQPPPIASENIELPDINSEYSDSDDEDRPRTFDPPEWAQSPELRQQLEQQSHMNPDDIFGRIGPLRMEEIFRTRQSRFRSRTSSANWAGPDQLTAEEESEYARRMGFE